ncbi:ABC transporter permease [Erythrobacteraceae bacterium WH01K]|nr:ABC transporter permease [Erythrobacteraceae bacterium WH01K]
MREWAQLQVDTGDDGAQRVAVSGPLTISSIALIDSQFRALEGDVASIDLSGVTDMDTIGAWTVHRACKRLGTEIIGPSDKASNLIETVASAASDAPMAPERLPVVERVLVEVGDKTRNAWAGTKSVVGFLGAVLIAMKDILRHPSRFRTKAVVHQLELVGVSSLPIIGLMSFLIGIVVAQQGAAQLAQFGAETLTINLTGRLATRELGVLMTAIMVAGRSGSAFAAQIGTMNLTEEIDAMRTIGVDPVEALVIPRILAAVFMMLLLGFFSIVLVIVGGATISSVTLGIPFFTFLERIQEVVPTYDLWVALIKAPVFGLIVAMAGCYQGMQVEGNSEEVGTRTTKAVVQAIFAVIVLDAFFAVFFTELGWA